MAARRYALMRAAPFVAIAADVMPELTHAIFRFGWQRRAAAMPLPRPRCRYATTHTLFR